MSRQPSPQAELDDDNLSDVSAECEAAFRENPDRFKLVLGAPLGSGTEGSVYYAELIDLTSQTRPYRCAVKKIRNHDGESMPAEFLIHRLIAANTQSSERSGILCLIGVYKGADDDDNEPCFYAILPICQFDLSDCIRQFPDVLQKNPLLFQALMIDFLSAMLSGLQELREKKVVHNDLKSLNIAFRQGRFVMLDFGLAQSYDAFAVDKPADDTTALVRPRGTAVYTPPEALSAVKNFPFAGDVYALGVIAAEMLGFIPVEDDMAILFQKIAAYDAEREKGASIETAITRDYQAAIQHQLCSEIKKHTDFMDCLSYFVKIMRHTLPEQRPNLETFECAVRHLCALRSTVDLENEVRTFYQEVANKVAEKRGVANPKLYSRRNSVLPESPLFDTRPLPGNPSSSALNSQGRSPVSASSSPLHRLLPYTLWGRKTVSSTVYSQRSSASLWSGKAVSSPVYSQRPSAPQYFHWSI